jgi:hypothetical protein
LLKGIFEVDAAAPLPERLPIEFALDPRPVEAGEMP